MVQYSEFNEPIIELYMDLDEFLSKIKIDYNEKNIVSHHSDLSSETTETVK